MDSARQVIRWSIPGGVLLIYTLLYAFIASFWAGLPARRVRDTLLPTGGPTADVLLAVFATIPLGYLVYQLYWSYFGQARLGIPWLGAVTGDRASAVASALPPDLLRILVGDADMNRDYNSMTYAFQVFGINRIGFRRLHAEHRSKVGREHYQRGVTQNLHLLRAGLIHVASRMPTVHSEFTVLSDIYHSLGACRVAVTAAVVPATALVVTAFHDEGHFGAGPVAGAVATCLGVLALTVAVLSGNRTRVWDAASTHLVFSLRQFAALPPEVAGPAPQ